MLRLIYSWWKGLKYGQVRYIHDRPMVVGRIMTSGPNEFGDIRYGVRCQIWDGYKWVTGARTEVTHEVYKNLGVLNVVANG